MTPYYSDDACTIYHGDCRDVLPGLSADVIVTDPPFNVGKDYGAFKDNMSDEEYDSLLSLVASSCHRQSWVTPTAQFHRICRLLGDESRAVVVRRGAQGPIRYGWCDQFLMVLIRGVPLRPVSNLWDGVRLPDEGYYYNGDNFGHPGTTAQPVATRSIDVLAGPGDLIVDPFLGTGTTLRAAKDLGRRAIGIEVDERWCEIAAKRLAQEVLAL